MSQTTAPPDNQNATDSAAEPALTPRMRRLRNWLIAILAVAAAVLVFDEFIKYRLIAKRWGVVVEGKLYRSGQVSKWVLEDKLNEHNIQVVIDLNGIEADDEHQEAEIATVARLGLEHHRFKLHGDGTGDIRNYANAIEVIHNSVQEGRAVLVHCSGGAQRTGGVVSTYRMLVRGESPQDCYNKLDDYGWKAYKDMALVDYVNSHMGELAQMLVERGVIDEVPDPLPVLAP